MMKNKKPNTGVATLDKYEPELEVISKSNDLVNGYYTMTTLEYQFITTALMIISQKNEANEFYDETTIFEITALQFQKVWGYNEVSTIAYKNLKRVAMSLQKKQFWYYGVDKKNNEPRLTFSSWFSYVQPSENGSIKFGFPSPMIELLKKYRRKFTWFYFHDAKKLKKVYSWRLYEFIHQYKHIESKKMPTVKINENTIRITVDRLKAMYQLEDKYPVMSDFRRKVINESVTEINKNTNLKLTARAEKNGRNIVAFIISYTFEDEKHLDRDKAFNIEKMDKNEKDQDRPELFTGFTEKTKKYFYSLLCDDGIFQGSFAKSNESMLQFQNRLKIEMENPDFLIEIIPHLIRLGYDPKFKDRPKNQ